jgi:arylsulfatase A-like enzyme
VHLHVTGPGIAPGSALSVVTSHVDLAPTWLGLAGVATPQTTMDGRSFVQDLVTDASAPGVPPSVRRHLAQQRDEAAARSSLAAAVDNTNAKSIRPNGTVYIEYHGLQNFVGEPRHMDSLNNTYVQNSAPPNRLLNSRLMIYDSPCLYSHGS